MGTQPVIFKFLRGWCWVTQAQKTLCFTMIYSHPFKIVGKADTFCMRATPEMRFP